MCVCVCVCVCVHVCENFETGNGVCLLRLASPRIAAQSDSFEKEVWNETLKLKKSSFLFLRNSFCSNNFLVFQEFWIVVLVSRVAQVSELPTRLRRLAELKSPIQFFSNSFWQSVTLNTGSSFSHIKYRGTYCHIKNVTDWFNFSGPWESTSTLWKTCYWNLINPNVRGQGSLSCPGTDGCLINQALLGAGHLIQGLNPDIFELISNWFVRIFKKILKRIWDH